MEREGNLKEQRHTQEDIFTDADDSGSDHLKELRRMVAVCRQCELGSTRKQAVFGAGNLDADLVFIGEAPGATEDEQGLPFVGRSGQILSEELQKNGISRGEVFIANVIKCRPPGNRDPRPEEIAQCEPYLQQQIEAIQPKLLCTLGRHAAMALLKRNISIMKMRGEWQSYRGIPLFISLHPSAVLYQRSNRPLFDEDIAALAREYHKLRETRD